MKSTSRFALLTAATLLLAYWPTTALANFGPEDLLPAPIREAESMYATAKRLALVKAKRLQKEHADTPLSKLMNEKGWTVRLTKAGEKRGVYEVSVMEGKTVLATMNLRNRSKSKRKATPRIVGKGMQGIKAASLLTQAFGKRSVSVAHLFSSVTIGLTGKGFLRFDASTGDAQQYNTYNAKDKTTVRSFMAGKQKGDHHIRSENGVSTTTTILRADGSAITSRLAPRSLRNAAPATFAKSLYGKNTFSVSTQDGVSTVEVRSGKPFNKKAASAARSRLLRHPMRGLLKR